MPFLFFIIIPCYNLWCFHVSLQIKSNSLKLLRQASLILLVLPAFAAAAAKLLQSCPTLCDPIDGSPPGSPIPGILQARTLEWVAISFSNTWKWKLKVKSLSRVRLLATPWTATYQAPPSMGFSRQEYWSGVLVFLQCHKIIENERSKVVILNRPNLNSICM